MKKLLIAALLLFALPVGAQDTKFYGTGLGGQSTGVANFFSPPMFAWYVDIVGGNDASDCHTTTTACKTLAAIAGKGSYAATDSIGALIGGRWIAAPPAAGVLAWYTGASLTGAEGTTVASWTDSSGAGHAATQATEASKPTITYQSMDSAHPGLNFADGAALTERFFSIAPTIDFNVRNMTILAVTATGAGGNDPTVLGWIGGSVGDYGQIMAKGAWGGPITKNNIITSGVRVTSTSFVRDITSWHGVTGLNGDVILHNPAGDNTVAAGWSSIGVNADRIGTTSGSNLYKFSGVINEIIVSTAMSAATLAATKAYLTAKYDVSLNPTKLVVFTGHSMTAGYYTTNGLTYPRQTAKILGKSWTTYNEGISSITTTQMISDAATYVDPVYNASYQKNVIVVWEGRNDIVVGGKTAQQAYDNLVTYCQARRAVGFKVVIVTVLPSNGLNDTTRTTLNASIVSGWQTFADGLADIAADSRIGDNGDQNDGTYYVDGIHMNATGQGVMAGIVATAVQSIP